MIKSNRELAKCRRDISKWNGIKRVVSKMLRDFEIEEDELPELIERRIDALQSEIDRHQETISKPDRDSEARLARFSRCPRLFLEARLQLGLTQTQLADRVGLKTEQINRYEKNGYGTIRRSVALEIARALRDEFESRGLPVPFSGDQ